MIASLSDILQEFSTRKYNVILIWIENTFWQTDELEVIQKITLQQKSRHDFHYDLLNKVCA